MSDVDALVKSLNSAVWEMGEAFKGLQDEDLWKRPHPRLLSIGELASHVAYGEVMSFLREGFQSPLVNPRAEYYTSMVDRQFSLTMGAKEVLAELRRVHEACMSALAEDPHEPSQPNPNREGWTWAYTVEYQAFHFAYHAGQMYSVRHLLGHEPADN